MGARTKRTRRVLSLRSRIVIAAFIGILVPLLVTCCVVALVNKAVIAREARKSVSALAGLVGQEMAERLQGRDSALAATADQAPAVDLLRGYVDAASPDAEALAAVMHDLDLLRRSDSSLARVFVADAQGNVLGDLEADGTALYGDALPPVSTPKPGHLAFVSLGRDAMDPSARVVQVLHPIMDSTQSILGYVGLQEHTETLAESFTEHLPNSTIQRVFLLDETGHLIARSLVATNLGDGTAQVTEHISGVLLAGGTLPASYRDTRGVLVLGAYYSLPAEDWTVLVEQQYRASMAPVAVVLTWLTGLLVIMLAAGYGAARSLGVRLERPIHDSVDAINDTLQRLSSTIAQQASGAQEQAAAVNQVSTTMDELSRTAQEIARATGETLASAEKGNKAYQASLESMSTVSERVGVAAQHILALGEKRRRIGEVSSIISGIAEQIHLLSLNAAIEAAGAGEYGRRFAVVATQVKELAAATRQSSNEVRQLVDEISNSTSSTIMVTEQATHQVAVTSSLTDEAQTELDAIVQRIQAISSATQQQQVANAEVVSAMHGVSDVAQQSAQGAQDVAQSTEELIASMMSLRAILAGK